MRIYNGAPDSSVKRRLDEEDEAERELRNLDPKARCVYFPSPGFYEVWSDLRPITEQEHSSRLGAIRTATRILKEDPLRLERRP